jgi:hypothetical protein
MTNKFVFFISTGRCGTGLFSEILNIKDNITAYHEHKPVLNGPEMFNFLKGDSSFLKSRLTEKKKAIKNCDTEFYVDTSHIFIKSWGWFLKDIIPSNSEVFIVILRRNKESVIDSFSKIHQSGLSESGRNWLFTISKKNILSNYEHKKVLRFKIKIAIVYLKINNFLFKKNIKKEIVFNKFMKNAHHESLDFHYDETYAMAKKYKQSQKYFNYFDFNFDTMLNKEGIAKLFNFINQPLDYYEIEKIKLLLKNRVNSKKSIKRANHKYRY